MVTGHFLLVSFITQPVKKNFNTSKADQDKILLFSIRITANVFLEITDFSIILSKNNYCCNIYFLKVTDILSQNPLFAKCILTLELKVNGFLILGFPMFIF